MNDNSASAPRPSQKTVQTNPKVRDCALDNFRGLTIVALIFHFFYTALKYTPDFLRHMPDPEPIGYADFIAPFFCFAMAMAYAWSLNKTIKENGYFLHKESAIKRFARRFLAFVGLGLIIQHLLGFFVPELDDAFNIFTMYGIAGLYSLFFVKCGTRMKLVLGIFLMAAHQMLTLNPDYRDYLISRDFGAMAGGISWCGFILVVMAFSEVYKENPRRAARWTLTIVAAGAIFFALDILGRAFDLPWGDLFLASKHRASMSYLMTALGAACGVFWLFARFSSKKKISVLTELGGNSFCMYFVGAGVGNGLSALFNLFIIPSLYIPLMIAGFIICEGACYAVAYLLYKKNIAVAI